MFGKCGDTVVKSFAISNGAVHLTMIEYGATLLSVSTKNRLGDLEEITLNYQTMEDLIANHGPYYGCTAGRVANRIKHGLFTVDGVDYKLAVNNGANHLHGGIVGFDQKVWKGVEVSDEGKGTVGVEFSYLSVNGEEGYPGNLQV